MKNKIGTFVFLFAAIISLLYTVNSFAQLASTKGENMKISSPAFKHNQAIPSKFTCEGEDLNPALTISDVPTGTKTLALIVDDPDAPMGMWVHWVIFNIPPALPQISENSIPGKQGINDFGRLNYGGPCPPSGEHRYFFKLYALDATLNLKEGVTKKQLEEAMKGHTLSKAELVGLYRKVYQ